MMDLIVHAFLSLDLATTVLVMFVFFLAGTIKGVVGFGLPLFAISVLASVISLPAAIAANVGPSLVTNARQAFRGPYLASLIKRLWPFLVPAIALTWVGIAIQVQVDPAYPGLVLGALAVIFAAVSFSKVQLALQPQHEMLVGVLVGIVNGVVTGITGIFVLPGGLYIQALGLSRDELVQALGILFLVSTIAIGGIFVAKSLMTPSLAALSVLAIFPAVAGMSIGERLRSRISEAMFRKLFLAGIAVIGVSLILRNGLALVG
ncbi:MAG: sulfite exporter TauE/SafE family protein [Hyphomicrobiales bacterium]